MAANDHMYDITKPGSNNIEKEQADIVPLQRCPHLYIKYTAAKGNSYPPPSRPSIAKPIVVDPHEPHQDSPRIEPLNPTNMEIKRTQLNTETSSND